MLNSDIRVKRCLSLWSDIQAKSKSQINWMSFKPDKFSQIFRIRLKRPQLAYVYPWILFVSLVSQLLTSEDSTYILLHNITHPPYIRTKVIEQKYFRILLSRDTIQKAKIESTFRERNPG